MCGGERGGAGLLQGPHGPGQDGDAPDSTATLDQHRGENVTQIRQAVGAKPTHNQSVHYGGFPTLLT